MCTACCERTFIMIKVELPTPLQELGLLEGNRLFMKRDDLTDLVLGGNKARKLEWFMKDALKNNADYIVTYGSAQSNHCRMTAAASANLGLPCMLILAEDDLEPEYDGNYFLYDLFDVEVVWTPVESVSETIEQSLTELEKDGFKPYFIEGGGHGVLGTHAYVEAYKEIEFQKQKRNLHFDYIFTASGTGTTQAGLVIGNHFANCMNEKVIGISIARKQERGVDVIYQSINNYMKYTGSASSISKQAIHFLDAYIGDGYGSIQEDVLLTIKQVAKDYAILLDPVYTAKAFWGMTCYLKEKQISGKNILFVHTGGTPLLFAHRSHFQTLKKGLMSYG